MRRIPAPPRPASHRRKRAALRSLPLPLASLPPLAALPVRLPRKPPEQQQKHHIEAHVEAPGAEAAAAGRLGEVEVEKGERASQAAQPAVRRRGRLPPPAQTRLNTNCTIWPFVTHILNARPGRSPMLERK